MWMICYVGTWKGTGTPQFQGDREAGENKDEGRGRQGRHQKEAGGLSMHPAKNKQEDQRLHVDLKEEAENDAEETGGALG